MDAPPFRCTLLAALLAVATGLAPFASASDGPTEEPDETDDPQEQGEPDDESEQADGWEDEERDVDTEVDDAGFRVESRRESPWGKDSLRAEFDTETARLKFEFEREGDPTGGALKLEVDEWRLLEYRDENGDSSFQPAETVLQAFRPETVATRSLQDQAMPQGHRIEATYGLGGGAVWTLSFLVPDRAQSVDGVSVSATEVKFDIGIAGFPYVEAGSKVAVQFRFQAESEFDEGSQNGLPSLVSSNGGLAGFLRWVNHSIVDGASRPVGVQAADMRFGEDDDYEGESFITFSYARGDRILHDPSVGVALALAGVPLPAPWGNPVLLLTGAVVVVAFVVATLGPRLRIR